MFGNMNIINAEALIKAFEKITCGEAQVAQISSRDFEIKQFTTQPLNDYEAPENFPNCCAGHKQIFQIGLDKYTKFPNCCERHKQLNNGSWFKKENYAYLPMKLVTTLAYTWHCIGKCIDNPNWFKEITDYIEYTKSSYGQFPDGYGAPLGLELYLHNVERNIEKEVEIPDFKKEKLLSFIKKYFEPVGKVELTDLNLLIGKYKEWLKIFPFEISFLSHLKQRFERQMPILADKGETNIYTGLTGFRVKTKKELITFLTTATLTIIKEINTRQLFQNDSLNDVSNAQMEILLAKRKLELEALDKAEWEDKRGYIKLLKEWLNGEKIFLKELSTFFKTEIGYTDFKADILNGMRALQKNDTNEACIVNIRENKSDKETSFRYWFKNFFSARYPNASITAEEEKGNGRIDLKISHKLFGEKIIEFKGWWNQDKGNLPEQVCSYLTDFENEGFIIMINHLQKKEIINEYKELITQPSTNYIPKSWKENRFVNTDMLYYESKHKFSAKEKKIYHFVFNVFFSNQK